MWLLIHAGIKVKPFNKRGLVPYTASQSADAVLLQFCICSIVSCAVSVRGVRGFGRYVIECLKIFFMQMDYKFIKNLVHCIHDDSLTCTGSAKAAIKKALWQRKSWLGFVVRRAGLLWSQQDFERRWSVPLFKCLTVLEFSFILFDLCLLITFFNFIMNYVPIVTFWIFTYHKIWILSIMFCFI